ncbi:hypothetical protein ACTXT7_008688 [Hymenolepis weldensis]
MCQKTLATGTAVYACDHWRNGLWVEGIIRALRGSMVCEVDVDGQTWVSHRNYLRPQHAAKSSKLKMGPWISSWMSSASHHLKIKELRKPSSEVNKTSVRNVPDLW